MATRKAAKKSTKKSTKKPTKKYPAKKKPSKKPKRRPKPLVPGNDPIIVGGGSVNLDFDTRFGGLTAPPGKRKFRDSSVNLTQVVVLNSAGTVINRFRLSPTDRVVICYTGSTCP